MYSCPACLRSMSVSVGQLHKANQQLEGQGHNLGEQGARTHWLQLERNQVNRVLSCNFKVMKRLGDRVLRPFLQGDCSPQVAGLLTLQAYLTVKRAFTMKEQHKPAGAQHYMLMGLPPCVLSLPLLSPVWLHCTAQSISSSIKCLPPTCTAQHICPSLAPSQYVGLPLPPADTIQLGPLSASMAGMALVDPVAISRVLMQVCGGRERGTPVEFIRMQHPAGPTEC